MAKVARKVMKIFGSAAGPSDIAEFGSFAAGTPVFTTDPAVIQSLSNYLTGWFGAVVGGNSPTIEDMNALCYLFAYQLSYSFQAGVAEWDSTTTYYIGSIANDGSGKIYYSLTDSNLNHAVTDTSNWKVLAYNPLTTAGDLVVSAANGVPARLGVGSNAQVLVANSGATNKMTYLNLPVVKNCGLAASVSSNALTVALKDAAGSTPSAASPVIAPFRNATATTGTFSEVLQTAALSIVVPTLATLGHTSAVNQFIWVYLVNDAGTLDIGVSNFLLDENTLQSCTQISSSATSASTLYTTSTHSGAKPIKVIGRMIVNEATAGTWATTPSELTINPTENPYFPGKKIGYDHTTSATIAASGNDMNACRVFASLDTVITRLGIFLSANAASKPIVLGIYAQDNSTGLPAALLSQTAVYTTAVPTGATADGGYKVFDLSGPVYLKAGTAYWLAFHSSSAVTVENAFNSSTTGQQKFRTVSYTGTLPNPFGTPTGDAGGSVAMGGF